MDMDVAAKILTDLEPLFTKAKAEGLWFFAQYQQLWFSPKELRAHHKQGLFIWSAENWRLRPPQELVDQSMKQINDAQAYLSRIQQRIADSG